MKLTEGSELDIGASQYAHMPVRKYLCAIKAAGAEQCRRQIQARALSGHDGACAALHYGVETHIIEQIVLRHAGVKIHAAATEGQPAGQRSFVKGTLQAAQRARRAALEMIDCHAAVQTA